jgi:DNA-binding SARP family transcriptional activator/predicted negative regulator of RcsB-dependent stress response
MRRLEIRLLGRFEVLVDARPVPAEAWPQRRAADLVKVLALAPGHRMPRDEVLESLWPRLGADAAASNLHKAASYARRALGARGAIVLRSGMVELAPEDEVTTDVERFERGDDSAYGGDLLPDDRYAAWALAARARLRRRRLELLREHGAWGEVLREDPADEEAHRALMRRFLASGDRLAAARQLSLLRDELARLGMEPSPEALALAREVARGPAVRAARLLHAPLEGRERELAAGSAALRRAAAGDGGALLVRGAMGIGKTRLVEAVLAEAEQLGFHTLRGAAHEEEGRTPYAPLVEALDPLAARRPEFAGALTDSARAALSRLLPSTPRAATTEDAVNRHRLFSAVAQLLAQAAAERGVVLAIDDLHAVDEATAALLHHLARSAAGERLLVVAALRDEPLPKAVALVRASLLERGAAVEVALGPLGRAAIEAVTRRSAGRPLASAALAGIERSAAGNPFFAEELAASVDAAGEVTVPPRLREIVARRLERLEPLGAQLLAALAVIDDGFTGAELRALAGVEPLDRALAAAEEAGVLDAVRGRYRFRHALVRQELAARMPEAALRRTHADAAALLAAEDAPPEAVAHHLLRAGRARDAVPLLTQAAEWAAAVGAYRDGAEWAELALEHAEEQERPGLLELRARLFHGAGEAGAVIAYAEAIAAAPAERVPALRAQQARACLAAGDIAGARAALEGVRPEHAEDRGELILLRAMVAWHTGDWEGARRLSAEAHRLAPNPSELATLKGMVAHLDGSWEQHSRRELTQVWDTPDLAGRVFDGYLCVTEYVLTAGDPYDRLAGFAKRLRAQAQQAGARRGEAFAATVLGEIELLIGNLEAARAHLADAAGLSREVGAISGESLARTRLGETLLHLGDRDGARAQLEQALELAHVSTVPQHLLFHVYGALLQVPDDEAEALAMIDRAETLFDPRWVCQFCPTGYHVAAAGACTRAGALERAREFLARAEQGAAGWLGGPWPAAVAEARAELLLAEGDRRAAREALRRAAEGYAAAGQLLNERRARAALERLRIAETAV